MKIFLTGAKLTAKAKTVIAGTLVLQGAVVTTVMVTRQGPQSSETVAVLEQPAEASSDDGAMLDGSTAEGVAADQQTPLRIAPVARVGSQDQADGPWQEQEVAGTEMSEETGSSVQDRDHDDDDLVAGQERDGGRRIGIPDMPPPRSVLKPSD